MDVGCKLEAPAALPAGKEPPVRIGLEAGWAQYRSGWWSTEKSLLLAVNRTPTIQPVARRHTDSAIHK
jgi:hypothetical protein